MRLEASNRTDLALKALGHLETNGECSGRTLAQATGTTPNYIPQVVRPLTAKGWVQGTPGPGGGYALSVGLDEISVLDVIEAVEGPSDTGECVLRGASCPVVEQCALHDSWVRARGALLAELGATSVKATMAPAPRKGE